MCSLLHLAATVEEHGTLDACSAFEFENYMQQLKKIVRSGQSPLVQIAKRLGELCHEKITVVRQKSICFKKPNNAYILNDHSCCEVVKATNLQDESGNELFTCRVYDHTEPEFQSPCDSRIVGVHKTSLHHTTMKNIPSQLLVKQAIMIPHALNKIVFMAILHMM